jgi:hypothetical protein
VDLLDVDLIRLPESTRALERSRKYLPLLDTAECAELWPLDILSKVIAAIERPMESSSAAPVLNFFYRMHALDEVQDTGQWGGLPKCAAVAVAAHAGQVAHRFLVGMELNAHVVRLDDVIPGVSTSAVKLGEALIRDACIVRNEIAEQLRIREILRICPKCGWLFAMGSQQGKVYCSERCRGASRKAVQRHQNGKLDLGQERGQEIKFPRTREHLHFESNGPCEVFWSYRKGKGTKFPRTIEQPLFESNGPCEVFFWSLLNKKYCRIVS